MEFIVLVWTDFRRLVLVGDFLERRFVCGKRFVVDYTTLGVGNRLGVWLRKRERKQKMSKFEYFQEVGRVTTLSLNAAAHELFECNSIYRAPLVLQIGAQAVKETGYSVTELIRLGVEAAAKKNPTSLSNVADLLPLLSEGSFQKQFSNNQYHEFTIPQGGAKVGCLVVSQLPARMHWAVNMEGLRYGVEQKSSSVVDYFFVAALPRVRMPDPRDLRVLGSAWFIFGEDILSNVTEADIIKNTDEPYVVCGDFGKVLSQPENAKIQADLRKLRAVD